MTRDLYEIVTRIEIPLIVTDNVQIADVRNKHPTQQFQNLLPHFFVIRPHSRFDQRLCQDQFRTMLIFFLVVAFQQGLLLRITRRLRCAKMLKALVIVVQMPRVALHHLVGAFHKIRNAAIDNLFHDIRHIRRHMHILAQGFHHVGRVRDRVRLIHVADKRTILFLLALYKRHHPTQFVIQGSSVLFQLFSKFQILCIVWFMFRSLSIWRIIINY